MQLNEGWLVGARRVPSPHHDCRPDEETPSLLVVHNISLPPGNLVVRGLMRCSLVPGSARASFLCRDCSSARFGALSDSP